MSIEPALPRVALADLLYYELVYLLLARLDYGYDLLSVSYS